MSEVPQTMRSNYSEVRALILVPCMMHANGTIPQLAEGIYSPGEEPYGFHHILSIDEQNDKRIIATLSRNLFDGEQAVKIAERIAASLEVPLMLNENHYNAYKFML